MLITDGWADCPDEKGRVLEGIELGGRHVVVQLTRHADSQANEGEFLRRNAFLRVLFLDFGVYCLPPWPGRPPSRYSLGETLERENDEHSSR